VTCYTRHEISPGAHQDIPHEHEKAVAVLYNKLNDFEPKPKPPTVTVTCEAEERNKKALYEIEKMVGTWQIDLGLLRRILTGTECEEPACAA